MRILALSLAALSLLILAHPDKAVAEEPNCMIVLYSRVNFEPGHRGGFRIIFTDVADLRNQDFDGWAYSFVIVRGRWTFFKNRNISQQLGQELGPGLYSSVKSAGIDHPMSSMRCRP